MARYYEGHTFMGDKINRMGIFAVVSVNRNIVLEVCAALIDGITRITKMTVES